MKGIHPNPIRVRLDRQHEQIACEPPQDSSQAQWQSEPIVHLVRENLEFSSRREKDAAELRPRARAQRHRDWELDTAQGSVQCRYPLHRREPPGLASADESRAGPRRGPSPGQPACCASWSQAVGAIDRACPNQTVRARPGRRSSPSPTDKYPSNRASDSIGCPQGALAPLDVSPARNAGQARRPPAHHRLERERSTPGTILDPTVTRTRLSDLRSDLG
jgi:hypothetical protein